MARPLLRLTMAMMLLVMIMRRTRATTAGTEERVSSHEGPPRIEGAARNREVLLFERRLKGKQ